MSVFVKIDGVIQPIRVDIFSPSNAEAGTIVVDAQGTENWLSAGAGTSVTVGAAGVTYQWNDCRIASPPRWMGTFVRVVLRDSRWRLEESYMRKNYNTFLPGGVVRNDRDLNELWEDIAKSSWNDLPITAFASSLKIPAQWVGKRAKDCAAELLKYAAQRMVYDPVLQRYIIAQAGDGAFPDRSLQRRRPVKLEIPRKVLLRTGPILYESEIPIETRVPNSTGVPASLASVGLNAQDYFSGFEAAGNDLRALYRNACYRWWEATGVTFPRALGMSEVTLLPYRSIPHLQPEIRGQEIAYSPRAVQNKATNGIGMSPVQIAPGDPMIFSEYPVIPVTNAGSLKTDALLVCCYYAMNNGKADYEEIERDIPNGTGIPDIVELPWINPIRSTMADVPDRSDLWEQQVESIANAYVAKHGAEVSQCRLAGMVPTGGSGQVGAVRYRIQLEPRRMLETIFAFNHVPRYQI